MDRALNLHRLPPTALVMVAICSLQVGSALAYTLFPIYGTQGMLFLRMALGGLCLCLVYRAAIVPALRKAPFAVLLLGVTMTAQSGAFYEALARIPMGVTVSIEFIGPLAVALATSREWPDVLCIVLAAIGIVLLTPAVGSGLDPLGIFFALAAAAGWACFIVASRQLGRAVESGVGLALSMTVSGLILVPLAAVPALKAAIAAPHSLGTVAAIAVFSAALPYLCEYLALKSLPPKRFGVLVAMEPVVATLIALVMLGEQVAVNAWIAIGLITLAAAISALRGKAGADAPV